MYFHIQISECFIKYMYKSFTIEASGLKTISKNYILLGLDNVYMEYRGKKKKVKMVVIRVM